MNVTLHSRPRCLRDYPIPLKCGSFSIVHPRCIWDDRVDLQSVINSSSQINATPGFSEEHGEQDLFWHDLG